jgi:hypothetical protein
LNPLVAAVVAEISAARIEARIRTLVAFGTRHTLSDTTSETTGIGAARRWIQRELQACSAATGGRLQVAMDEHTAPSSERMPEATAVVNVVATLPGTDPAARERLFIVSGHYDSRAGDVMDARSAAPGANDDASGVAAVMEMACVMASRRFDATLVFMAVAGEEQGLLGADFFAADAKRKGLRIEAMVTNDIIGSPVGDSGQRDARQVRLFADGLSPLLRQTLLPGAAAPSAADAAALEALRRQIELQVRTGGMADFPTNQLGRHLKDSGERYMPGFTVTLIQRPDRFLRGGDHLPFLNRGYAAVRFTEPFENFMHQHQNVRVEAGVQYGDLPEFVDFGYVADVARINAAGLATLALAPAAPLNAVVETSQLSNDTTLRWDAGAEPDLAGYRVLWRDSGASVWQGSRDVGRLTRTTLKGLSKDNLVFGVQAVDRDGNASLPSYPVPARR